MEDLTIEHITKNNFTAIDLVKYFKHEWSDEQCDFYLWEKTCYPFSMEATISQLNQQFKLK